MKRGVRGAILAGILCVEVLSMTNKTTYIPCLFAAHGFKTEKEGAILKPEQLKWWNKDTGVFYHPYILLNAFMSIKSKDFNLREKLGIGKETLVLGDSGGFQIWKHKADIPVLDVLHWQEANADRGFIVDDVIELTNTDEEFQKKVDKTVRNCEMFAANRSNSNMLIYKVLHGHSEDRIRRWYDAIEPFPFEAWSVSFHPESDVWGQVRLAMFLYHMGYKGTIHFLGVSGKNVIPALIWLSNIFEEVLFDSSSWAIGVNQRLYTLPNEFPYGNLTFGDRIQGWHGLEELPCTCPVCREMGTVEAMRRDKVGLTISLHNLYLFKDKCEKLRRMLKYEELFLKYVGTFCDKDTLLAIDFAKACLSIGYPAAVNEYSRFMSNLTSNQEQSTFFTMLAPIAVPKLRKAEKIPGLPGEKEIKPRRKKKNAMNPAQSKIERRLLDLSETKISTLEVKDEKPSCYRNYDGNCCQGSDFCPEFYDSCRSCSFRQNESGGGA
jgi:hypothetical protein